MITLRANPSRAKSEAAASKLFRIAAFAFFAVLLASPLPRPAAAADVEGETCHNMLLLDVIDGDTVYGYIDTSDPIVAIRAKLRLKGIDTPEITGHAQCVAERNHGKAAKTYIKELLAPALASRTRQLVRVCGLERDKYALRRLGRLELRMRNGWVDVGALLMKKGYALPYQGGRRGSRWCDCLERGVCPA